MKTANNALTPGTCPTGPVSIKSLGARAGQLKVPIKAITLLGSDETLTWSQSDDALVIQAPRHIANGIAVVFKINASSRID